MILLREAGAAAGALTGDSFGYSGPAGLRFFSDLYKAKGRKFNRTSQTKLPLRAPINPIFTVKTMADTSPRPFSRQELIASTPKTGTR